MALSIHFSVTGNCKIKPKPYRFLPNLKLNITMILRNVRIFSESLLPPTQLYLPAHYPKTINIGPHCKIKLGYINATVFLSGVVDVEDYFWNSAM